jgi:GDPmannose 4,6-dehydratase
VDHLLGDASKAKRVQGWTPQVDFRQLVEMMVDADLQRLSVASRGANPLGDAYRSVLV